MECAITLTPLALADAVFYFLQELNIPEGPEHEAYQYFIDVQGEVLKTPHGTATAAATS